MNKCQLKDSLKIVPMNNLSKNENTSPIKGHVIIKDNTGKIVVDKDNLVVENGRILLANLFCSFISDGGLNGMSTSEIKINNAVINLDPSETSFSTKVSKTENIPVSDSTVIGFFLRYGKNNSTPVSVDTFIENPYTEDEVDKNIRKPTYITYDQTSLSFKIEFNIVGSNETAATMNELGLFIRYINTTNDETTKESQYSEMMMSRIVFDTLSINSSTSYAMEYYLYF